MTWTMSIKRAKGYYKVLSSPRNFLNFKNENLVSLSTNNDIDRESFKWGFLAQKCSFVRVSYITYQKTCDKRKVFTLRPVCERVE